ncbi:MAG TPA: ABC transporter permease [Candidatus Angelobacter sp.]|nr:ABC transporter permease [Candidatus Angelobacter sp.]
MKALRRFLTRLMNALTRRAHDERLREEIEEHIALQTADNLRAGMSPAEARRQAILKFGAVETVREELQAEGSMRFILLHDIRYSLRVLRKSPGFTLAAVLTLAMAIGANMVVFSVLNAMILRPLNLPEAESLYGIERASDHSALESYPNYLDLRDRNRSFEALAAFDVTNPALDTGQGASLFWAIETSGNYFDALHIEPYLGRFFHASDEHGPNSAPYIVLSYPFWHTHFHDDRTVVDRVVQVNKHPFTVIGVTPPGFFGTLLFVHPDFFVPIVNQEQMEGYTHLSDRGSRSVFMVIGHLKAGVGQVQAASDLNSIGSYLEKTYPQDNSKVSFTLVRPGLFGDYVGRPVQQFLTALMLLAGLILLAACANLGSLFAARAADRAREIALRLAIGSSRARILRALFTESVLISLIGGGVGVWGSILLLRWLSTWRPIPGFPGYVPVNPDFRVYAMALLVALASGFIFGAVPVRQVLRTDPYQIVKAAGGAAGRRINLRDILLCVQIAICAVLVTSSMVAVRGLVRSLHGRYGFDPTHAVLATTDPTMGGYSSDKVAELQRRMITAAEALPGVQFVGLIDELPLDNQNTVPVFTDQTTDLKSANAAAQAVNQCNVSPDYLRAAGTTLLAGRHFTAHDDRNSPRVAIINQEFARRILGSEDKAVGHYFKLRDGTRVQVVGIVEDGKYTTLAEDPQLAMFLPILQSPSNMTVLVVRSERDPRQLITDVENTLRPLDPGLPVNVFTWTSDLYVATFPARVATVSLGVLGVMAAMLAITGIFGMAAYSISKRIRELGVRIALGAQPTEVLRAALGRAFRLLAFGSAAGLILGVLASRVLAFVVYQATPRDPLVLLGVVLAMSLLGLLATWIPAQRALGADPLMLLRED